MRKILFRGKDAHKNNWVYGDLFHTEKDFKKMVQIIDFSKEPFTHTVDPDTVGQYTGVKDKDNTKIFEGDILEYSEEGENILKAKVVFSDAFFLAVDKYNTAYRIADLDRDTYIKVIGNIHDNPELIK